MSQLNTFTITQPTKIDFGCGAVSDLGEEVKNLGGRRVFLVLDPGVRNAGLEAVITEPLRRAGLPFEIFDRLEPEPRLRHADDATAAAQVAGADCVVGAGGGSAMDVAKAVGILLTNGGKAEDYLGLDRIPRPGVPKIMIPTTAGTGAEVTFTAVFVNEHTRSKAGMNGNPLYPDLAILDPTLTLTTPPEVTATTGIDAFTHALEAYLSRQAHVMSDMHAREAIGLISKNLGPAYDNGKNLAARSDMLLGSLLAGKALALAGVGLVHAMAYPLGGMFDIPHGLANAVLLPYVLGYNLESCPGKLARVAELMGCRLPTMDDREAAAAAVSRVTALTAQVGIPTSLADLDISMESIPEMARIALTVSRPVANNPRRPEFDEVVALFQQAFRGMVTV